MSLFFYFPLGTPLVFKVLVNFPLHSHCFHSKYQYIFVRLCLTFNTTFYNVCIYIYVPANQLALIFDVGKQIKCAHTNKHIDNLTHIHIHWWSHKLIIRLAVISFMKRKE